jgi:hypothetical protein
MDLRLLLWVIFSVATVTFPGGNITIENVRVTYGSGMDGNSAFYFGNTVFSSISNIYFSGNQGDLVSSYFDDIGGTGTPYVNYILDAVYDNNNAIYAAIDASNASLYIENTKVTNTVGRGVSFFLSKTEIKSSYISGIL